MPRARGLPPLRHRGVAAPALQPPFGRSGPARGGGGPRLPGEAGGDLLERRPLRALRLRRRAARDPARRLPGAARRLRPDPLAARGRARRRGALRAPGGGGAVRARGRSRHRARPRHRRRRRGRSGVRARLQRLRQGAAQAARRRSAGGVRSTGGGVHPRAGRPAPARTRGRGHLGVRAPQRELDLDHPLLRRPHLGRGGGHPRGRSTPPGETDEQRLWAHLRSEPAAAGRVGEATPVMPMRRISGYSTAVEKLHGQRWALTGNAGAFLDPVFSSGVTLALESSSLAARLDRPAARGRGGGLGEASTPRW